jgi:hypothetical protein
MADPPAQADCPTGGTVIEGFPEKTVKTAADVVAEPQAFVATQS